MNVSAVLITREMSWPLDARIDFPFEEKLVCTECPNIFRRFELAASARFETVYVQDDDVIVDIRRLSKLYDGCITNIMPLGFQNIYAGTGVTMVGFGCFFPRRMAEHFVKHQQFWRDRFGDAMFDTEADRFFTFANQPFNEVMVPLRQISRPVKMSERPNHYQIRSEIFTRLKDLGEHP